jgi:hypothetical protein
MARRISLYRILHVCAVILAGSASFSVHPLLAQSILGGIEVKDEKVVSQLPRSLPKQIYVTDFALDAEKNAADEGVRGALPGPLGRRLPRVLAKPDPAEKARQIVETMAESLVQHLKAKGVQAQRLRNPIGVLPLEGWLVQGAFTVVDQGNRLKRAAIGFGQGATHMDVQVGISDLASAEPRAAFAVFGTTKDPSLIPGAVVTKNPYVAAAKFVLEKNAGERDVQKTAAQIADEIVKFENQVKKKPG